MGETILSVYENLDKIKEDKAFLSYLFTTAKRLIYKRAKRNKDLQGSTEFEIDDISNSDYGPDEIHKINELNESLDKLKIEQKEAIILCSIQGFSYEEASKIQKVSIETLKKRIYRGKQKLKEILEISWKIN